MSILACEQMCNSAPSVHRQLHIQARYFFRSKQSLIGDDEIDNILSLYFITRGSTFYLELWRSARELITPANTKLHSVHVVYFSSTHDVNVYICMYMFVYVCIYINCIYVVLSYVGGNKESIYLSMSLQKRNNKK